MTQRINLSVNDGVSSQASEYTLKHAAWKPQGLCIIFDNVFRVQSFRQI